MASATRATLEDLYRVEGKAELIGGRIVHLPTGYLPGVIAGEIFVSLRAYARATKKGVACPDNTGFAVPELPSGRESFSPDAAYYSGPLPKNPMQFIPSAPTMAAEVRSENDYGESAEADLEAKRADYFQAGTMVVWDVDPRAQVVRVYRASDAAKSTVYRRGEVAEAEPAVPGWTMKVDEVFAV